MLTAAKPSRAYIVRERGFTPRSASPAAAVTAIAAAKPRTLSPKASAVTIGSSISAAKISSASADIRATIL